MNKLNNDGAENRKDPAMHMFGILTDLFDRDASLCERAENMLVEVILAECLNTHDHLRARALWVLHQNNTLLVDNEAIVEKILELTIHTLLYDDSWLVRVHCAIVLREYIKSHFELTRKCMRPSIERIGAIMVNMLDDTDNEDVQLTLDDAVRMFPKQLEPIILDTPDPTALLRVDEQLMLNSLMKLVDIFQKYPLITNNLKASLIAFIWHILESGNKSLYKDIFDLLEACTADKMTPMLWRLLGTMKHALYRDGVETFILMKPSLANYVTVDVPAFVANVENMSILSDMCKYVSREQYSVCCCI